MTAYHLEAAIAATHAGATSIDDLDEYGFVVTPVVLGRVRSMMNGVSASTTLDLIEAKPQATGNVLLRCACRTG